MVGVCEGGTEIAHRSTVKPLSSIADLESSMRPKTEASSLMIGQMEKGLYVKTVQHKKVRENTFRYTQKAINPIVKVYVFLSY